MLRLEFSSFDRLTVPARPGVYIQPRRTFTYVPYRRAQENSSNNNNGDGSTQETTPRRGILSTIKSFLGGKSETAKPKVTYRPTAPIRREGSLSSDSIFAEDQASPKLIAKGRTPSRPQQASQAEGEVPTEVIPLEERNRQHLKPILDPRPKARIRWERKMVIRAIRRRGRLTKQEELMRTEREALCKSHWFKTSVKKLVPLARQIAGKNIDDAILQMRFSKKKVAKDVMEHLKHAKNIAIVRHGMGLGSVNGEILKEPITITLKSGERKVIKDPTSIYIAQAWVNRGPFDVDYEHRARGRINVLRPPHTSISVLLKEEKTRIREWREREEKALRQRKSQLWTQLPDRKITAQNQYYSW